MMESDLAAVDITLLAFPDTSQEVSNPFAKTLVSNYPPEVTVLGFTWTRALLKRYEVFHVQWPEYLLRSKGVGMPLRRMLFLLLLTRLRLGNIPVVCTEHNLEPHEPGSSIERWLLAKLQSLTRVHVYLSRDERGSASTSAVIPHQHYGDSVPSKIRRLSQVGGGSGLLFFGQVRPYKGVESLVEAFRHADFGVPSSECALTIAGNPFDAKYAERISALASGHSDISLDLRHLPDEELYDLILASRLVVLPYRRLYNSGAVLLALTLGRPVLVPRVASMIELAQEVGERWVLTFEGELTSQQLVAAYAKVTNSNTTNWPDLSARDPVTISATYATLFSTVVSGRSRRQSEVA